MATPNTDALAQELKRMYDQDRLAEALEPGLQCFSLVQDLDHWAGYGIYTPDQLWTYLDAC